MNLNKKESKPIKTINKVKKFKGIVRHCDNLSQDSNDQLNNTIVSKDKKDLINKLESEIESLKEIDLIKHLEDSKSLGDLVNLEKDESKGSEWPYNFVQYPEDIMNKIHSSKTDKNKNDTNVSKFSRMNEIYSSKTDENKNDANVSKFARAANDKIDVKDLEEKLSLSLSEKDILNSKIDSLERYLATAIIMHLKSKRKLELIKLELVENYKKLYQLDHTGDKELDIQALVNSLSSLWPINL